MRPIEIIKPIIIDCIAALYTLLFIYAAVSKLLDFENFQIQLRQSSIVGAFAGTLFWLVPLSEILISIGLWIPRFRTAAFFCCYTLMLMFSGYIFLILHFSSYVPCSCGGVLDEMDWMTHFYFNLAFVALAAAAIFLMPRARPISWLHPFSKAFFINTLGAIGVLLSLYYMSDRIVHEYNTFTRRYKNNVQKIQERDLRYNSYYFAGSSENTIYLGNYTAPLLITEFDLDLNYKRKHYIQLDTLIPYRSLQVQVNGADFYVTDGMVPVVYRGTATLPWKARVRWNGKTYFNQIRILDSLHAAIRCFDRYNHSSLALLNFDSQKAILDKELLQKQMDGAFDVDGILSFDIKRKQVIYTHYYRNELIVCDDRLSLIQRNKTIDTVSKAQIEVSYINSTNQNTMSAPPLTVNRTSYSDNGYTFVNSELKGRYESKVLWKQASVVDVYETKSNRYIASFYVYHIGDDKLRSFIVQNNHFYALIGNHLVAYKLHKILFANR
jgi:uncharacterized membrane protein YphA (DoxX/SURF4 family)